MIPRPPRRSVVLAAVAPLALMVVPALVSATGTLFAADPEEFLELPADQDACVRDTEYMRFHHMDLLLEIRDEVQRDGKRRGEIGFSDCYPPEGQAECHLCMDCHDNRIAFCNRCHDAVDLRPDCFGCHYYPESPPDEESHGS